MGLRSSKASSVGERWILPAACLLAPFASGALGSVYAVSAISGWYVTLPKPIWTPPNYLFGPVWTFLYVLMGVAAFLVWRARKADRSFSLWVFFAHLVVNALWSLVFFGLHAVSWALLDIFVLWAMIIWLIVLFVRQSSWAGWLLVPYLLWVTYAASLNLGIVFLQSSVLH